MADCKYRKLLERIQVLLDEHNPDLEAWNDTLEEISIIIEHNTDIQSKAEEVDTSPPIPVKGGFIF